MKSEKIRGFGRAVRLMAEMLREIFDEAAYTRFLQRTQTTSSRQAYAKFCRDRDADRERRPRCC